MSVNDKLLSEIVAHEIDVLGYGNSVTKKIINILNKSDITIFDKITKIVDELPSNTVNVKRFDRLLKPIMILIIRQGVSYNLRCASLQTKN